MQTGQNQRNEETESYFPPCLLFSFQNANPAFCLKIPYMDELSKHSPPYSLAEDMLSRANSTEGNSTPFSFAILSAWFASLMASETPKPGRVVKEGA